MMGKSPYLGNPEKALQSRPILIEHLKCHLHAMTDSPGVSRTHVRESVGGSLINYPCAVSESISDYGYFNGTDLPIFHIIP